MKVVLFCGGLGTRMRDSSQSVPKPMVRIGYRPILWHLMKYYAHFGHRDFILCLGYGSDVIKDYFLRYDEAQSNDFVMNGGGQVELLNRDIHDWRITFVDTGASSSIGERLLRVRPYLERDEVFLANYSDGLTDLDLPRYIAEAMARDKVASFLSVRPSQTFHIVWVGDGGIVAGIEPVSESDVWINGGFFVFKRRIFDYLEEGEDLVAEPFERLVSEGELVAHRYMGSWTAMDTFKDHERMEEMWNAGKAPWMVW